MKRPETGSIYFVMVDSEDFPPEGAIVIENEDSDTMEVQGRVQNLSLCRICALIDRINNKEAREQFETRLKVKIGEL